MENKKVGMLVVGIGLAMALIIWIFNRGMTEIVSTTCSHGPECSMYSTIETQTWLSIAIVGVVLAIGFFIMYSKPQEKIVLKQVKIKEKKKKLNLEGLDQKEKEVIEILQKEGNAIFQRDLMEKIGIGKVGMTRLIDRLESKGLVIRKRRGMNNIVVFKN